MRVRGVNNVPSSYINKDSTSDADNSHCFCCLVPAGASSANKGVDYVRPSADAEPAPTQRGPSPQMLQVQLLNRAC